VGILTSCIISLIITVFTKVLVIGSVVMNIDLADIVYSIELYIDYFAQVQPNT